MANLASLYEKDFLEWTIVTAQLLEQRNWEELDLDNLIEEILSMGRSEKKALYSNLKILLMHLLKYKYQSEKRTSNWRSSIREHRQRIAEAFIDSPSLKNYFDNIFDECYQKARLLASDETGLNADYFPEECPFSVGQVLDENYLP
ncbi:MAG: DUF29 domain-containing protein [Hydrococcus sp. C42_A2020_068]|uniref:DUF29 domain-containing protein n=1 Tax=Pleurocapsa sp. PCC 7327 TaxID=118163 RepID=UPI00029FEE2D|nr:DUF29 domain-containing protein [Pleurocapsa sp. PCC 7327]AFY77750.1 protein of unknown function DUF29 [Pleurocapsa sp. PCC 7327]MBF2021364.1 DUF29 domain-containing protein [Hydrococcus sp. C42_A2020_068]